MKIALVTGGSRGLGKSMSQHIAAKGNSVVLTYNRNKSDAEEVVKQIENTGQKAPSLELDLSDSTSFDAFVENLQGVLCNRSGNGTTLTSWSTIVVSASAPPFARTTEEQFDELMNH
jgi:NAD(P)-dependent dehydrogenase (short-subunit alcohol dehydrogenase family)